MTTRLSKLNWKLILAIYLCVLIGSLIFYGYNLYRANIYSEIPIVLSLLDPELYKNDFYVQEMLQFTPRYYYYYLIYFTTKLGLSVPLVCFFYYGLSFFSLILALYAIGQRLTRSKFAAAVLAFFGLTAASGTIGLVDLFRTEPIPAIYAMGVTIWGIYFCLRERFILGYFLFGIACILQFLIGFLPGILMAPVVFWEAKKKGSFWTPILAFIVLAILVCLIYLPMIITGNTDSGKISNAEFVYLYGTIRHPHHFIFSKFGLWNSRGWFNLILFIVGGLLCIKQSTSLQPKDKIKLYLVIFTSILLLIIGYVFVEVYPSAFITKLQLARTTPFTQLIILIAVSTLVNEEYKNGNIPLSFLLITTVIVAKGGILLFIVVISLWYFKLPQMVNSINSKAFKITGGLLFFGFLLWIYSYNAIVPFLLFIWSINLESNTTQQKQDTKLKYITLLSSLLLAIFMVLNHHYDLFLFLTILLPYFLERRFFESTIKRLIIYVLSIFLSLFLILGLSQSLPEKLAIFFQDRITVYPIVTNDLIRLAVNFKQISPKNALALVPPSDESFRFYSQRAVVFNAKNFPFTDRGIQEWKKRFIAVLGETTSGLDIDRLDSLFHQRSSTQLMAIAKQFRASYILTRVDWHPDIKGVVIAREGDWIIYKIIDD